MWSSTQKIYLREFYKSRKDVQIAKDLGKSLASVRKMRQRLKLTKTCGRHEIDKEEEIE